MPDEPRIAAVIPAYNAERIVAAAIESLQRQTVPPAEIIVVDDGSQDDTSAVATRAGARVIRQENRGPAAARNRGIAATTAEWIALLDADDVSYRTRSNGSVTWTREPEWRSFLRDSLPGRRPPPTPAPADFAGLWAAISSEHRQCCSGGARGTRPAASMSRGN